MKDHPFLDLVLLTRSSDGAVFPVDQYPIAQRGLLDDFPRF
jgi:hypothetical protein